MYTSIRQKVREIRNKHDTVKRYNLYKKQFFNYSFVDCKCKSYKQFEASITRLYHTIEKGLSYENYRIEFGKENINNLIISLEQYCKSGYNTSAFFYKTALSCLEAYYNKNKEFGVDNHLLKEKIAKLEGSANSCGGIIRVSKPDNINNMTFEEVLTKRHSIRHFSQVPVTIETIEEAIRLAQYTPSACNRQGWKTRIISDKGKIKEILENQNGNRGFGQEIDKLLLITSDLRAQQRNRELFQAFIDGGMYAENIINALFYKGVASIPLSAALTMEQEKKVRALVEMEEAELLILFVGVGNYPNSIIQTTRSERRPIDSIEII